MKIVDEKGKLFGKINLIDLLVVIVLIAAVLFLAVRLTKGSDGNPVNSSTKLTYTTWHSRPMLQRTMESIVRLVSPIL